MSTLQQRLKAIQGARDCECEAMWEAYLRAIMAIEPALKRHGVPGDVAERWFEPMPAGDVAMVEAALHHMPDEVAALERTYRRMMRMETACGPWLRRKAEADEHVLAQHAATDRTGSP